MYLDPWTIEAILQERHQRALEERLARQANTERRARRRLETTPRSPRGRVASVVRTIASFL